jgi:very-short-patch-repair endonuclease
MIAQGLRVLRFTNDRILNETENVLEEIAKYLPGRTGEEESNRAAQRRPTPRPSPKGRGRK